MNAVGLWTIVFVSLVEVRRVLTGPIVHTKNGAVEGFTRSVEEIDIDWFLGIPYAKPPLGELRFRKPEPSDPWTGILNASSVKEDCTQGSWWKKPSAEDCLYVNVYVPSRNASSQEPLDVMVYIHGGAYYAGSGNYHEFLQFVAYAGVAVVAVNYRLGPLGFLYLGTEESPGNQGLWDQHLALRWVHENIAAFGGNPNSVTINGPSAGAGSVGAQILSLKNAGLFKGAIMSSGSFPSPWGFHTPDKALKAAQKFIAKLNCSDVDLQETVMCLRNKSVPEMIATGSWDYTTILTIATQPTVDGDLITDDPIALLKRGEFNKNVSILGGNNGNEGSLVAMLDVREYFNPKNESLLTTEAAQKAVDIFLKDKPEQMRRAAGNVYLNHSDPEDGARNRDAVLDLIGDYLFVCPENDFLALAGSNNVTVYNYFFTQTITTDLSNGPYPGWTFTHTPWIGSGHAFIIMYQIGYLYYADDATEADKRLSAETMDLFRNFMASGKALFDGLEEWPRYSNGTPIYVEMKADGPLQGIGPRAPFCEHLRSVGLLNYTD